LLFVFAAPALGDTSTSLTLMLQNSQQQHQQQTATSLKSNTLILKYILKTIVDWIILSGVASQKLKINLYAALLNFMHILKGERAADDGDGVKDDR
jgi:Nuclear pore complex scaffold, nucleoporins 186/192/205